MTAIAFSIFSATTGMFVIGVHYHDTITLGAILVGVAVTVPALFALFKAGRWKANADAAEETVHVLAQGQAAYKERADRLEREKTEREATISDQRVLLAELEARPSQQNVLDLINHMDELAVIRTKAAVEALEKQMSKFEERAQERHELQMAVMHEIVSALRNLSSNLEREAA